ncbi:MAG: hypothetical protein V3V05_08485 [Pontiella sp.]
MKQTKLIAFIAAWFLYILFSLLAYPELKITVMLFSIPLTMLGGWLYTYKGALFTTLLTIPYHYFMLQFHSSAPDVLIEAFNPFGIGTQLCFSLSTALLKTTQLQYLHLNEGLENIIEERTRNLRQLTDHLIETNEMNVALTSSGLLSNPMNQLNDMLVSSNILSQNLKTDQHSGSDTANIIENLTGQCLHELQSMEHYLSPEADFNFQSILKLVQQFDMLAGENTKVIARGDWQEIKAETCGNLYPIVHGAITNALRHAAPTRIIIHAQNNPTAYVVSIENDGKTTPHEIIDGMGLPLMRYRASRMGASLSIGKGAEDNTRIECVIPRNSD